MLVRIERRQVIEKYLVLGGIRMLEVYGFDLNEGEVPLAVFWGPDLSGYGVARSQIKFADLRRRDVNIIRAGEVVIVRRPEKSEPFRETLQHAFGKDQTTLFCLRLQDLEDEFLLPHACVARNVHFLGYLSQRVDVHFLQIADI